MYNKKILSSFLFLLLFASYSYAKKDPVYSQQMVERRALQTFFSNAKEQELATAHWDYVPGLVANGVLKAWQQYPEKTEYYDVVKKYADHCLQGADTVQVGKSNIDDLAAGKIFFALYEEEMKKGNVTDAQRYKNCVTFLRNKLKYDHSRIPEGNFGAGGFFHKAIYPNQMWLDGLYMGPALYAQYQSEFGEELGHEDNMQSWTDIALQFKTIHQYTYDPDKQLNYHGWSSTPYDKNSFWARKTDPFLGCSPEFWGRGMGWYFAALVDVLDWMPKDHPDYQQLVKIVNDVAQGLKRWQDKSTGCWFQLLQYNKAKTGDMMGDISQDGKKLYNQCNNPNYLESSASSMFTYAFYKGVRIGILDKKVYLPVADKAYKGLIKQFIREGQDGNMEIIQSCASAGLGPAKNQSRTGSANYYLCGEDVVVTKNEGKAIGPFIMASLENELRTKN